MPYPSEHSARIVQPLPQNSSVYARKNISPGIDIVLQRSKGDNTKPMKVQSYRFKKNQFTAEEAKQWLKSHEISYISFEPASEPSKEEDRKSLIKRVTKELAGQII